MNNDAQIQGFGKVMFVPNSVIDNTERNNKTKLSSSDSSIPLL